MIKWIVYLYEFSLDITVNKIEMGIFAELEAFLLTILLIILILLPPYFLVVWFITTFKCKHNIIYSVRNDYDAEIKFRCKKCGKEILDLDKYLRSR